MSDPLNSLNEIKQMMQTSSKFTSISGWSGVWVGTVGFVAGLYIWFNYFAHLFNYQVNMNDESIANEIFLIGLMTFLIAVSGGFYFIYRKAKRDQQNVFSFTGKKIIFKFLQPLLIGAIVILTLYFNQNYFLIAAFTLLFYGISLLFVSQDTIKEMKYLAWSILILAILSLLMPSHSLIFWILGFGVTHIFYGILFLMKYDFKN